MRTILFIIQKEFIQIFRNKTMLAMIFVLPLVQLIVLVNAATMEMKNINLVIVDKDLSSVSRELTSKFRGSPFFKIVNTGFSIQEAESYINENKADVVVHIPENFERNLVRHNEAKIQILINAINGTVAGIGNAYVQAIIQSYNKQVISDILQVPSKNNELKIDGPMQQKALEINHSYWYNPELNYKTFMVPAILVLLVTLIGMFLASMNLVREKEIGTIEQINVTPIRKYQFIAGKLVPFLIIALFELAFGLTLGKILFDIPIVGSLLLIFLVAIVYLFVILGMGLFVSTVTETQQQAMFISWFFLLVFILMSGIFTAVENMPDWARKLDYFNPIYYFMRTIRMILLKGSTFKDIKLEFFALLAYGVVVLSLSVWRYRKTS